MSGSQKCMDINPITYTDNVWQHTKGNVGSKLERAQPYGFFLSPVDSDSSTHIEDLTLSFTELLDKSLGDLVDTLHVNLIIELKWLYALYRITGQLRVKMSIIFEKCDYQLDEIKKIHNLCYKQIKYLNPNHHHHTKLSMFAYADGSIRIVVMTANLRKVEFMNITQGFWVSQKFPLQNENDKSDGDSKTNFKKDILRYLHSYKNVPLLTPWIQKIEKADCSKANVFFIPSIPGVHNDPIWGKQYLKNILKTHACIPFDHPSDWPIISQCSSLGNFGARDTDWLLPDFVENLSASTYDNTKEISVNFNLIFPSVDNVLNSWGGSKDGFCVPYHCEMHQKQTWLKNYLHKWVSNSQNRTKTVPHIKTYCRISPCNTKMSWFLLTSANLSKSAWGKTLNRDQCYRINQHEAGVLFLPSFVTGFDTFSLNNKQEDNRTPPFPMPFDLPLSPYSTTDQPWQVGMLEESLED